MCVCLELEVENEVVTGFLFKVSEHSGSLFQPINEDFFLSCVKVISDQSMKTVICFPYILYVLDKRSVRVSHFITVYSAADYIVLASRRKGQ